MSFLLDLFGGGFSFGFGLFMGAGFAYMILRPKKIAKQAKEHSKRCEDLLSERNKICSLQADQLAVIAHYLAKGKGDSND
jgi:hypothetical protein